MIFGRNRRVEEDLERIRRANLPQEKLDEEDRLQKEEETRYKSRVGEMTAADYFAMIIAALSVVLPYALIILGAVALAAFLLSTLFLR